jgi:hypothetical protein
MAGNLTRHILRIVGLAGGFEEAFSDGYLC